MWNFNINKIDKEHLYRMAWHPIPKESGIAGIWVGEYRHAHKGEYYINESDLTVYKTLLEKSLKPCFIARIVKIKKHEYFTIGEE